MSKTAYLRNGETVVLHDTLDTGEFVIERMYEYSDYEGRMDIEPCGVKELIKEVFMKAPIEKKHDDLIKIIEKIEVKNKELANVESQLRLSNNELRESEKFKTDLQNHIINKSELKKAKRITVFSGFRPYTITEDKEKRSLSLSYQIDVWEGKMSAWIYTLDYEGARRSFSKHVNPKVGILINATDEEILEIGKKLVMEAKEINDYTLNRIPHEYLTDELKVRKIAYDKNNLEKRIANIEGGIKTEQSKLRDLKSK